MVCMWVCNEHGYIINSETWVIEKPTPEPEKTYEEIKQMRAVAYVQEVDPLTAHIQRLRDESPVDEAKIAELTAKRRETVERIKAKFPYPSEEQ